MKHLKKDRDQINRRSSATGVSCGNNIIHDLELKVPGGACGKVDNTYRSTAAIAALAVVRCADSR